MKIAIASEQNCVSGHFGHCEGFTIYEVDNQNNINKQFVENPGHRPGYLPVFLKKLNIDIIIAGGMGETAQQLFEENGIKVIVGAQGLCDEAIKSYVDGKLKTTGNVCSEHKFEGNCDD